MIVDVNHGMLECLLSLVGVVALSLSSPKTAATLTRDCELLSSAKIVGNGCNGGRTQVVS
jgi:hypothetical protein